MPVVAGVTYNNDWYEKEPVYNDGEKKILEKGSLRNPVENEDSDFIWNMYPIPTYRPELGIVKLYGNVDDITKQLLVFPDAVTHKIFNLWTISTWDIKNYATIGFLSFVGLPDSGKTRFLELLHELAYRGVLCQTTEVAIPRISHKYQATLLIDEIHKLGTDERNFLVRFLKPSYRIGSVYIKCDKDNDTGIVALRNFGFKAFAGEKSFKDDALDSRCINIRPDKEVPKVKEISYLQKEIDSARSQLLNYKVATKEYTNLGNEYTLNGRIREIYNPLLITALNLGIDTKDILEHANKKNERNQSNMEETDEYAIIDYLVRAVTHTTEVFTHELCTHVGCDYNISNAMRLRNMLKDMDIEFKGTGITRYIPLNDKNVRVIRKYQKRFNIKTTTKTTDRLETEDNTYAY
jgi:hypothetical protein